MSKIARLMLQGAAGAGGGIEYIGSVTKTAGTDNNWNSSGEAPDVMSIAETGDLVVYAFTADIGADAGSLNWAGMSFSLVDFDSTTSVYSEVGYRFVQAGDANPYLFDYDFEIRGISAVFSVFRNVSSYVNGTYAYLADGMPNPPEVTANGNLWIAAGSIDDDFVDNFSISGSYTLADSAAEFSDNGTSSTALAYRIETLTSDDPPAFGGSGNDQNIGWTVAFD